jgi:hypothetical protein
MRREEFEILVSRGIVPAMGMGMDAAAAAASIDYVGLTGKPEDAMPWRRSFQLAMDAQPGLVTAVNGGIPAFLTNYIDPEVIRVLFAPMRAAEIYGETKKGDWTTLSTQFPIIEPTGETSSYGDFNNNGSTGANVNWVPRQSYTFQTISQWGERELDMYGVAKINYASEISIASAFVLAKFLNKSYFFGVGALANYGGINDPNLIAPITPGVKAAGGLTWAAGTSQEIYADVLRLFGQLQTQMAGLVPDLDAKMVLAISPTLAVSLMKVSTFNITAKSTLMENFPNLEIRTAPEFSTAGGELAQLILKDVDGVQTTYAAFTEKMRAHPVIPDLSAFKQKKSAGTWGTIIRRPIAVAQMLGM